MRQKTVPRRTEPFVWTFFLLQKKKGCNFAQKEVFVNNVKLMDINSQAHIKAIAPDIAKAYQFGKEQKYDEAYQILVPYFEAKEIPSYFEEPCGWAIYRYIKKNEVKLSSMDIRKALAFYIAFASCKPSALHSCIMVQAVNLEKKHENDFRFI